MGEVARIILGGFITIGFFFLVGLDFFGWLSVVVLSILLIIIAFGKGS
jgi:hypothetical protein